MATDTTSPFSTTWSTSVAGSYAIKAIAYDADGGVTTSATSTVTVTSTSSSSSLPAGQTARDIGSPAIAGSTSYSSGVYTITAGGADIWGTSDQFQFVYQQVVGDVDVVARVNSMTFANSWSKAGVMVRETLDANARHAMVMITAGRLWFQWRLDPGGYAAYTSGGSGAAPAWVRLKRTGSQFEALRSADGISWTSIGVQSVPMATAVYVGLAVTSHNTTATTTAVIDRLNVASTSTTTNQPPSITLTSPASGTSYTAPATVTLSASASDPEGRLSRVEFYVGSTLVATDTSSPFSASWSTSTAGSYAIKAIAYDADGGVTTSATSTITVTSTTSTVPTTVTFQASPDHYTLVTSYRLDVFANGADPNRSTPIASSNLGKPTPDANNDITVDRATFFSALAPATYEATVSAIDSAGESRSAAITFVR